MLKKITGFLTLLITLFVSTTMHAQVTTSSINGTVTDAKGETLQGATVTAEHEPSGTKYTTISKKGGVFNLPGLRSGGPYKVTVNFVGYKPQVTENITLALGDAFNINAEMASTITDLAAVTVTGTKRKASADKNGATTNINPRMMATLPTISRSITDFTRITPQANGTSFAGRDNRLNNVTVDGANLNNNFGLSSDLLPGGGNPIALDAFSEISVNISPYDVKQSGFTGAGVSALTKSGTNTFHGSVYGSYRNQSYNGTNVAGTKLPAPAATSNKIYGATLGGPIIKNKLFFFLSGEIEKADQPGVTFSPKGGSGNGTVSNVPIDSLRKLSSYLNSKYGFEPGAYDNYPTFASDNYKVLAKLDWNISTAHKLTLKYSDFRNTGYSIASSSGGINGASGTGLVTYQSSRFGLNSLGFNNSNYKTVDKVRTGSFELNSNFQGKFANQLLATISKIRTDKTHDGATFPFADILGQSAGSINNYLSFGNEPFNGNNNIVVNDVYTITDNFSYFAGKHTITAGINYEYQKVGNMFMAGSQGYYVFNSLDDFTNNRAPKLFSINYSLVPGEDAVYSANLKVGQLGLYLQDEVNINPRFKLTYGLRMDKPIYPEQPLENPAITALPLYAKDGSITNYNGGQWPTPKWLFSPRAGFRWDVEGDKKMIIRGGTGIFTGRIPFVYLTNQPSTSGMYTFGALVTSNLQNFLFNPDPHAYNPFYNTSLSPTLFPTKAGTVAPSGGFALIDPKFKFPQVWRTNFAVDKQLGSGWNFTFEALYTKDLNNAVIRNANQKALDTVVNVGPGDTRARFSSSSNTLRRLNAGIANAVILENTSKGGSISISGQLSKSFSHGFYGSLAYTYTYASEVTANPGSQAASVWSGNPTSGTQNDQQVSYSQYAAPHRIVATLSYRVEYLKHLASTFTFFYEGSAQGPSSSTNTYSYIYNGDINQDGNSADLMYIPKDPSEIKFGNLAASGTTPAFTPQQQSDAFFQFISNDKYLKNHMGQTSERNAGRYPFYHRVDFNFQQELFTNIGRNRNSLIFNASVVNFLNLLNHDWGIRKQLIVNNPLRLVSVVNGVPTYTLATFNGDLVRTPYVNVNSTSTTYGIQLGLKYQF